MRSIQRDGSDAAVVGRAVSLLAAFVPADNAVSLSELARRTGLPKPTAHRLAGHLISLGMLERTDGGLRLGLALFELGQLVPRQRGLRDAARPYLEDLRQASGEAVHLAILEAPDVVYVDKLAGRGGPALPSRVGGRMPAHCTAVGKVLLARPRGPAAHRHPRPSGPPHRRTIVLPGLLDKELQQVRRRGIAYEYEESAPGVICVAVPIVDHSGAVAAAVSVSGWSNRLVLDRVTPALRTAGLLLSRSL